MQAMPHGGDVYTVKENNFTNVVDFSANINPLGMPPAVQEAAARSLAICTQYPDPYCRELCRAIAAEKGIPAHWVLCGNGAAELLFRLAAALRPRRALLAAPTFSEYRKALEGVFCKVETFTLIEREEFALSERFLSCLPEDIELLLLCNPNNPTGWAIPSPLLRRILSLCRERNIFLVVDECFQDFLEEPDSLLPLLGEYPRLLLLQAFTKLYGMPGLRLGYLLCANPALLERIYQAGQPWSVSTPAQAAGLAALGQRAYRARTKALIRSERAFLRAGLSARGFRVFGSQANFLFFKAPGWVTLREELLPLGYLIRSCGNFEGLDEQFYRIAVRTRAENAGLLQAIDRLLVQRGR